LYRRACRSIAVLANLATGQAYASFANMTDIIVAEPGTLICLVLIKTLKEATDRPLPLAAHTAEAYLDHGLLDMVVGREMLRDRVSELLSVLAN
jgi:acetyl-CoA carboxylase carboxyl transferase subunit beta